MDCSKCNGYATMLLNMVHGSDPVNLLELHGFLEHFAYYVSFGKFNAGHQRYNAFKKFVSEISEISANDINMTIKTGQSRHENVISINMNDAIPRDEKGIIVRIDNINGKKSNSNLSDIFIPYVNTFSDLKNKILRMKIELTEGSGFSKSLSDSQIETHILRNVNSLNVGEKLNDDNLAYHSIFSNEFSVIIPPSYYDATSVVNANNGVREKLFESDSKVKDIVDEIGFAPIFPDTCYHLTHYWLAAVDIPVASDNPVHYADAIRYNARTPLQGSLLPLTRLVWA
ncbi:putative toxin [Escherichia coli]|nr:putative toxin [Escherichia coli]SQN27203.1 putative toxin [Escherichia coli]